MESMNLDLTSLIYSQFVSVRSALPPMRKTNLVRPHLIVVLARQARYLVSNGIRERAGLKRDPVQFGAQCIVG